jgi:hypothetical protein
MNGDRKLFLSKNVSDSIKVSRVLCITLMIFVHLWPGVSVVIESRSSVFSFYFYCLLFDELSRSSVPLLSIISGVLFAYNLDEGESSLLIKKKFKTLIVPMILWSAIAVLSAIVKAKVGTVEEDYLNASFMEWVNRLFSITSAPQNLPLAFLRDIFVAACIFVIINKIDKYNKILAFGLAGILVFAIFAYDTYIILRPQIFLFFFIGYIIYSYRLNVLRPAWVFVILFSIIDLVIRHGRFGFDLSIDAPADIFHRISVALLLWRVALSISERADSLKRLIVRLEPMIFIVFCSHALSIAFFWFLFELMKINESSRFFDLFFFAQIPAIYLIAGAIKFIGETCFPRIFPYFSAKNVREKSLKTKQ